MMNRKWLLSALVLVAVVNIIVLVGVAVNRRGTPDATLVLTERELRLGWRGLQSREDSGVALELDYARGEDGYEWFDEKKLRALGFKPAEYRPGYGKEALPRQAYVVLEYDGPHWGALISKQEEKVAKVRADITAGKSSENDLKQGLARLSQLRTTGSRLVPIDASNDGAALRARYPDRTHYLITAAEVRFGTNYRLREGTKGRPEGYITRLLTSPIYLPARFHATLEQATRKDSPVDEYGVRNQPPRYRVTVNYGKRYEPWVVDLQPMDTSSR